VLRLTAWAVGARAYAFVAAHWLPHLPGLDVAARYAAALAANAGAVAPALAIPAFASVHAARGDWLPLEWAIVEAYRRDVPEMELAEALSLMMFPGSIPRFVEAAGVWLGLIRSGRVLPSPAFAAWAALEGQGGFDEAAGRGRAGQ
jgi:hypothetical protein